MEGQGQSPKLLEQVCNVPRLHHVSTTMLYTHVLRQGGSGIKSPLDCL